MWNIFNFNRETSNNLARIKKLLVASMNGVASSNMKHLGYKLNYGVSLLRIKELSTRFEKSTSLADCLWSNDCREMKIMATHLHPLDSFDEKKALKWALECTNMELAEQFSRNIAAKCPFASSLALQLLNRKEDMHHALAYVLATASDKKNAINEDDFSEIFAHATKDVYSANPSVYSAVARFLKQASTRDSSKIAHFIEEIDLDKGSGCAWVCEEVRTFIEYAPSK